MVVSDPLRPNSTDANAWSVGDHTDVDEEVTQPNAGNSDLLSASDAAGDDNDVNTMGFPNTIDDVDEVTNITVWTNGNIVNTDTPEVMITGEAYVECLLTQGALVWKSNSFDVSWNQAELDALQVSYRADVDLKVSGCNIDVCYVIVTYTATGGAGWGHKFLGVVGASIGKVSGIPTADVGKIKGV